MTGEQVGQTIQKNLELADVASPPSNTSAVGEAAARDRQLQQGVDYDAWTAAGVTYVMRGVVNGAAGEAELYDVASRQRVFGKTYQNAGDATRLAHRMADDAILAISGAPGIFSSRIALLTGQASGKREVAIMDPDGGNLVTLTSENAIVATPAWGRGGTEIFFTSYKDNNPDLYGINLNRQRYMVSRRPGLNTSPNWSQAAQRLAVTLSKDGNTEIYTMAADGSGLARLTNNTAADTAPAWSPDGSQVAFTSDETGLPQIYIMSANGSGRRKLTNQGYCDSPSWSPDGKKLAYVRREEGGFNVYMMDLASGTSTKLTNGGDNMEPSWAPNSRHLVFAGTRGGKRNIYLINTETKQAKQLTTQGTFSSPVWGPLLP
jgi:TolB protein